MAEKELWKGVSRRTFIKGTVAGAGAVAAFGLGSVKTEAAVIPKKWNKEADVVVIGYGGAGACAAIMMGSISSLVERNTAKSVPRVITRAEYSVAAAAEKPHCGTTPRR